MERKKKQRRKHLRKQLLYRKPEPISKYASMTREEKEASLIDTIYEMAEKMDLMNLTIEKLERENKKIKKLQSRQEIMPLIMVNPVPHATQIGT